MCGSKQTRLARAIVLDVIQDARVFETQALMSGVSWVGGWVGRRADVAGLEDHWQRNGNDGADKSWVSSKGHKCSRLEGIDAAALVTGRLGGSS